MDNYTDCSKMLNHWVGVTRNFPTSRVSQERQVVKALGFLTQLGCHNEESATALINI